MFSRKEDEKNMNETYQEEGKKAQQNAEGTSCATGVLWW